MRRYGRPWQWAGAVAVSLTLAGAAAGIASAQPVAAHAAVAGSAHFTVSGELTAVAATSPGNAWALGFTTATKTPESLIFHWNGRAWKRVASPGPAGAFLIAVAATSARNAWAVGGTAGGKAVILHWNGRAWKIV